MSRKRILFIDSDDSFVRDVAAATQSQGFQTIVTGSSTDGVERARQERPDLIVVNVELSPTNGWSVCTKLKKDDELKDIPVILTSSLSTPDTFEKHKKLKTRADEYLLKPYQTDDLVQLATQFLGVPDSSGVLDEDVVVEDESLATGDFDMAGLDEEIPVMEDEPLVGEYEASLEAVPAGEEVSLEAAYDAPFEEALDTSVDPLADAGGAAEGEVSLTDLPAEFGEFSSELGSDDALPQTDDFAAFESSFASLAPGDGEASLGELSEVSLGEASLEASLGEAPLEASLGEASLGAPLGEASLEGTSFEEFGAEEAPLDSPSLSEESEAPVEAAFDPMSALSGESESPFNAGDFSFDEAPLEVNTEGEGASLEASLSDAGTGSVDDFAAEFGATVSEFTSDPLGGSSEFGGIDSLGSAFDDPSRVAELESRVAELEAELEGYKATENTQDQELERLRVENNQRARELQDLRDQLREKEQSILDAKDAETKLSHELAKVRDEKLRREAAMKAFTQKAEQMSVQGKRLERELITAREELKHAAELKARVAELETAHKSAEEAANSLREQLDTLRAELDTAKSDAASAQTEVATVKSELETLKVDIETAKTEVAAARLEKENLQTELDQAKASLESAKTEKATLEEQLAAAQSHVTQLETKAQSANERAAKAREALRLAVEQLAEAEPSAA